MPIYFSTVNDWDRPNYDTHYSAVIEIDLKKGTANGKDDFIGAEIKYYEDKGKFYDMNGKEITLPPEDYPDSNTLGVNKILDLIC